MYGGSSINDVTHHILIKLLSNEISRFITLTGPKGKKTCFASTNYFKVLLGVCINLSKINYTNPIILYTFNKKYVLFDQIAATDNNFSDSFDLIT